MLKSIPGNRASLEVEMVAALVAPERRHQFHALLARLDHRGELSLVKTSPDAPASSAQPNEQRADRETNGETGA